MKKEKNKTVLLVGGGTGGHFYPIFRIYKALKEDKKVKGLQIFVVGSKSDLEMKLFSDNGDYIFLRTGKLHRLLTFRNLIEGAYLIYGLFKSLYLLLSLKPKLIFSKGGYVSLPIVFWARILRIPYFIHESDIVMGSSNKFAAKGAKTVFTGFPKENYPKNLMRKISFVGQIVKYNKSFQEDEIFDFGFEDKRPKILVTGGSQGAKNLNSQILRSLEVLLLKYDVIHQTGTYDYQRIIRHRSELNGNLKNHYFVTDFLDNKSGIDLMKTALETADLVVARAGATTIAEIILFKKPMILVPYKHASLDHQRKNAELLARKKAAVMILEDDLNQEVLVSRVQKLLDDKEEAKELVKNASEVFPDNALNEIVEQIKEEVL